MTKWWACLRATRSDTLLVRQIAVSPPYRRHGIGRAMLECPTRRLANSDVSWLEARIQVSSHASRRLFQSFAIAAEARYAELELTRDRFSTPNERKMLMRIGSDPPSRGTTGNDPQWW